MSPTVRAPAAPMRIAAAMRLYGVTARALRFYEEKGLIRAGRDRHNRRFYDAEAQWRLGWIAWLRGADLSIVDIQDILTAEAASRGAGIPVAHRRLTARREDLVAALSVVESAVAALAPAVVDRFSVGPGLPGVEDRLGLASSGRVAKPMHGEPVGAMPHSGH